MIKFNSKEENDEKIVFDKVEELIEIKKLNEMKERNL